MPNVEVGCRSKIPDVRICSVCDSGKDESVVHFLFTCPVHSDA